MKAFFLFIFVTCLYSSVASATVLELKPDGTVTTYTARDYLAERRHSRMKPEVSLLPLVREPKDNFSEIISAAADKYSMNPTIIHAVIRTESLYNENALSPKGAQGLMQLMPETAKELGVEDAFDPIQNIDGGTRYLRYLIDKFDGDLSLALAAYNAGEGSVKRYGGIPPYPETVEYIKKIENLIRHNQ